MTEWQTTIAQRFAKAGGQTSTAAGLPGKKASQRNANGPRIPIVFIRRSRTNTASACEEYLGMGPIRYLELVATTYRRALRKIPGAKYRPTDICPVSVVF